LRDEFFGLPRTPGNYLIFKLKNADPVPNFCPG
jgi:hypothetical protein